MRGLVSEYGKIILTVFVGILSLTIIGTVMASDSGGIKGFLDSQFLGVSETTKKNPGSNKNWKSYKAPEFKTVTTNIKLLKREKAYTFTNASSGTTTINCSEFFSLNNKWGKTDFVNYSLRNSNKNTQPFYIYTPGIKCMSSNSGTAVDITDKLKIEGTISNAYLLKFKKDSSGNIVKDSNNTPVLESYQEITAKGLNGYVKDYVSQFDVIGFKDAGQSILYYSVADDYDFKANVRVQIMVENAYGDGPRALVDIWKKF